MIEYLPWSQSVYAECLNDYLFGSFSILDIELGGQCNYHCIYCDSPNRDKKCMISLDKIQTLFDNYPIKWVFICGLGEPTVGGNLSTLHNILTLCEKHNAKCSIFTNLSLVNGELNRFIDIGVLNLLFKFDSFDFVKAMRLYGASNINKHYFNIDRIKKMTHLQDGKTNIAASIVPTIINKDEIIKIVHDCLENNIYPLVAELEDSGDAHDYYSQLALSDAELLSIKKQVNVEIGCDYHIPVCPAVICGIHIRYDGKITVDEYTGLSCHWFWLQEPKTHIIGDFNNEPIDDLLFKIEEYRIKQFANIEYILKKKSHSVFGGCGGDVISLLNNYTDVFKRRNL